MNEGRKLSTTDFVATGQSGEQQRREQQRPEQQPREVAREVSSSGGGAAMASDRPAALFPDHEASEMRSRWNDIQTSFVDQPRKAVEEADQLVASAIQRLAQSFSEERGRLEGQWAKGGDPNTEDLRVALQRYRSFFTRLLSI
jgi:hypothetical protein